MVERLEQALAIYEKLEMRAKTADIHIRLLDIFGGKIVLMDQDRSETHFRKAEALLLELPVSDSLAALYQLWAWSSLWKAEIRPALEAAKRSVEVAHQLNSASMIARAKIVMGACMAGSGRLREGFEWLERGWQEADAINGIFCGGNRERGVPPAEFGRLEGSNAMVGAGNLSPAKRRIAIQRIVISIPRKSWRSVRWGNLADVRRMMSEVSNSGSSFAVTGVGTVLAQLLGREA